jgi:RNA polymerase sigma-70 factor (ECF subfamily)
MTTPSGSSAPTDQQLVEAYRAGDEAAAAALVHRHGPSLARYLGAIGAFPGEVEDLVQESLFRAFRRIESWRGDAGFRTWLCTIAGNLLRDEHRKRKGRVVVSLGDHALTDHADPAGRLMAIELEARMTAALARLPRLQREVFLLRAQQEAEYAEIATALGTTAGAARVHFHHAVKALKGLIE